MTSELMRGPNRSRKMSVATIPAASTGITSLNPELLQMYVPQSCNKDRRIKSDFDGGAD